MILLKDALNEALFGSAEKNIESSLGPIVRDEAISFLEQCCNLSATNIKALINMKKSGEVIARAVNKTIIIDGQRTNKPEVKNTKTFPAGLHFSSLKGCSLEICNFPELESIESLFSEDCVIEKTSISIHNCPKLNSLKGLPKKIDGSFSCTNCQSITSLEGLPEEITDIVSIRNNGKAFKVKEIRRHTNASGMVYGESEEDEEANITEAFADGRLQMIWDGYTKIFGSKKKYKNLSYLISNVCGGFDIFRAWDKYAGSNIISFKTNEITDREKKIINDMMSFTRGTLTGFVAGFKGNELLFIASAPDKGTKSGQRYRIITNPKYDEHSAKRYKQPESGYWAYKDEFDRFMTGTARSFSPRDYYYSYSSREDIWSSYGLKEKADYIIAVILTSGDPNFSVNDIQRARGVAQAGMIKPGDVKQYAEIAEENLKRYKDIIAKNKELNTAYFKHIDSLIDIASKRIQILLKDAKSPNPKYSSPGTTQAYQRTYAVSGAISEYNTLMSEASNYAQGVIDMRDESNGYNMYPGGKIRLQRNLEERRKNIQAIYDKLTARLNSYGVPSA
jgi:hypothetical protein